MRFVAWSGDDPPLPSRGAPRVRQAAIFYNERRQGLGAAFTLEVEATIERIKKAPDRWPVLEQDVRKCLTHVFPYSILYTIEQNAILIVSVMHLRRKPGLWRNRLSESQGA